MLIQWKEYWKYDVRYVFDAKSDYSEENEDFLLLRYSSSISVWVWT